MNSKNQSLQEYLLIKNTYAIMKKRHARHMTWGDFSHKLWCEELIQSAEQQLAFIEIKRR